MPDRHLTKPKAVRMPGGLLAWIEGYAAKHGQPVNAVIVKALEEFREDVIRWETAGDATVCEDCGQLDSEHPPEFRERHEGGQ